MIQTIFFSLVFTFAVSAHATDQSEPTRELAQEQPPNEPPFTDIQNEVRNNNASHDVIEPEAHTKSYEDSKNFVPRWKMQHSDIPSDERLKQLNEERGLFKITKKKEYLYDVKKSPQDSAMGVRVGSLSMANLRNPVAGVSYTDIYKTSSTIAAFFDYEWQFFRGFGKLGLNLGGGFATGKGNGRFTTDPSGGVWGLDALEVYNFFLLPLSAGLTYRFAYFHNQIIVPYVTGGADYYVFAETRDDAKKFNYGATPLFHVAGGAAFLLDWFNRSSMVALDKDYGINHLYLTAEYRLVERISGQFDFSNQIVSGGFMVEY